MAASCLKNTFPYFLVSKLYNGKVFVPRKNMNIFTFEICQIEFGARPFAALYVSTQNCLKLHFVFQYNVDIDDLSINTLYSALYVSTQNCLKLHLVFQHNVDIDDLSINTLYSLVKLFIY